jgi:hypothetical protein
MEGEEKDVAKRPQIVAGDLENPEKILFTDQATIELKASTSGSTIRYTLDGSDPSRSGMTYEETLTVRKSGVLRAISVKEGAINSPEQRVELHKITTFSGIEFTNPYSEKYAAQGPLTLGNGKIGGDDFFDMEWLGWEGVDFEAIVDLGSTRALKQLSAGFMNNVQSWIFLPRKVAFYVSEDGRSFVQAGMVENTLPLQTEEKFRKDFVLPFQGETRYVRVKAESVKTCPDWHPGAGEKAWLFVDEIIIE